MTDTRITPWGSCSTEFGNPSGHSLYAAGFFTFVFLDNFYDDDYNRNHSKWAYKLSLLGTLTIISLIGFARLYVGLHSIN